MTVWHPTDDGHADLADHDSYVNGTPHNTFQRLRDEDPMAWCDWSEGKGFWSVTRHADILELNRNHQRLSSAQGIRMEDQTHEEYMARRTFQETDPPEHTRTRMLVAKAFSKPMMALYEDQIRELCVGILDQALALGEFDATHQIARQLPMRMLGRIAGLPEEDLDWLVAKGDRVLTGDSFFHLAGLGAPGALAGLNMCGAGRVVCLIDPVGDVYACPFAIHDRFLAGNVLSDAVDGSGGFDNVWKNSALFTELRKPQSAGACGSCGHYDACRGGCMAAKFFTGLPLDGPDPECVEGYGAPALAAERDKPRPGADHSRGKPVMLTLERPPAKPCNESPV